MAERNTVVRAMHDLGLAAWFGGSLMGTTSLNHAAETSASELQTARMASAGWATWTPINAAAIGVHLIGATGLALANWHRVAGQKGVLASTVGKTALTGAALAATAYARFLGKKIESASAAQTETATEGEGDGHPVPVEVAQRQLSLVQWTIPALTGALEVLNSLHGEQQRPSEQVRGRLRRLIPAA
jgi:hypothetical protein